jgi:phosphoglucomutase
MIITGAIDLVPLSGTLPEADKTLIINISPEDEAAYFRQIVSFVQKEKSSVDFPIVYSALHGAGANAVPFVLNELGFFPVCIQQAPDGSFGGLKTPNPEESVVYEEAIRASEKYNAKLLLATDPDCDRVGVMVRTLHGLELVSGNQIGALLIDYLAQTRGVVPGDTVITTIVSGLLGEFVSASYGFDFKRLLTGFKYIGEYAERLPDDKNFFFGYEESYGFLAGDEVRDKDAVLASALIAKMAVFYHNKGMTLIDRWGQLSETHGYCLENLHSMEVSMEKQAVIISALREGEAFDNLIKTEDYLPGPEGLPPANVLKYYFDNNAWAAIRPSGTEPKLKVYTGVKSRTYKEAKAALELLDKKILQEIEKL